VHHPAFLHEPHPAEDIRVTRAGTFRVAGCLLGFLLSILTLPAVSQQPGTRKIVGYYYGKSSAAGYAFENSPVQLLTHLIYSQVKPSSQGVCVLGHPDVDIPNLALLAKLRTRNPDLSILLSVGGWSGSTYFSDLAATDRTRRRFSASCVELLQKYSFDGLDIDWEYPVTGGKPTDHKRRSDKENFVLLLKQLRRDLDASGNARRALLTIASTCYRSHLQDLATPELSAVLDWFNLMCYDMNEMEPTVTFHHSGLFSPASATEDNAKYASCDAAVRWYLGQGVPPAKIVLGVPFYGQIWTGVRDVNHGLYQKYGGRAGDDGVLSFREIEQTYFRTFRRYWDAEAKVPWLYSNETKTMISYEDAESIAYKADYALKQNLGGMMFWDIAQDDGRSTLLNAIYQKIAVK
jgi:chitinase